MSSPNSVKTVRLSVRVDMRVDQERGDRIQSFLREAEKTSNKTEIWLKAIELYAASQDPDGGVLPQELTDQIDTFRDKLPVPTRRMDLLKDAWERYEKELKLPQMYEDT